MRLYLNFPFSKFRNLPPTDSVGLYSKSNKASFQGSFVDFSGGWLAAATCFDSLTTVKMYYIVFSCFAAKKIEDEVCPSSAESRSLFPSGKSWLYLLTSLVFRTQTKRHLCSCCGYKETLQKMALWADPHCLQISIRSSESALNSNTTSISLLLNGCILTQTSNTASAPKSKMYLLLRNCITGRRKRMRKMGQHCHNAFHQSQ